MPYGEGDGMAFAQRSVFRIEKYIPREAVTDEPCITPAQGPDSSFDTREVLAAIADLKAELAELKSRQPEPIVEQRADPLEGSTEEQQKEAAELRADLKEIYVAIEQTKKQIISLHSKGVNTSDFSRMTDELDAVVDGTENATEAILTAAETVEQLAGNLAAAITDESMNNMACDIQDQVVKIFEACNFQDLTGQRVTKVIGAFRFIEERVNHMMEIWGGVESFDDVEPDLPSGKKGDGALLNGPALESDEDVASQNDIDALFG